MSTEAAPAAPTTAAAPEPAAPAPVAAPAEGKRSRQPTASTEAILAELGVAPGAVIEAGPAEPQAEPQEAPAADVDAPAATPSAEPAPADGLPADPDAARREISRRWVELQRRERMSKERERRSRDLASKAERFQAAQLRAMEDPTAALEALSVDPYKFQQRLIEQRLQLPQEPVDPIVEAAQRVSKVEEQLLRYEQERAQAASQAEQRRTLNDGFQYARQRISPQIDDAKHDALLAQFAGNRDMAACHVVEWLAHEHQTKGVVWSPESAIAHLDQVYEQQQAQLLDRFSKAQRHAGRFAPAAPPPAPVAKPAPKASVLNKASGLAGPPPAKTAPAKRNAVHSPKWQEQILSEFTTAGVTRIE